MTALTHDHTALYLPSATIWGLDPRVAIRAATPLVGGLLTLGGAVLMARQRSPHLLIVGAVWSLISSVGAASAVLNEGLQRR